MKAKLATAISVVGVLGAGSAAALVNTQILDNGPTESGASKAVLPPASTVELSVPDLAEPDVETIRVAVPNRDAEEATTTTVETTTTTVAPVPEASGYLTSFNVGEAGVVTADVIEGQLVLVSAEPKAGWTVTKAEDDSNDDTEEHENTIEVEFVSSTVRVEFDAAFVDGQIVPHVDSTAIGGATAAAAPAAAAPAAGTPPAAAPAPAPVAAPTGDDDSYESEHEDEHESEHEDDDSYESESEHEDSSYESEHEDEHEDEHESEHEDERDDD